MPQHYRTLGRLAALLPLAGLAVGVLAYADGDKSVFSPNNLVVSRTVYDNQASNVTVGELLPIGCATTVPAPPATTNCVAAVTDGTYPYVFNNAPVDASFGVTSKIFLDQLTPDGHHINTLEVPNSHNGGGQGGDSQGGGQPLFVTSFSSKSELALNLSTDGQFITFMGYVSPLDALDVSNSNTPLVVDPTNPNPAAVYRAVAQIDRYGHFHATETNAYSGNNGRAAILNSAANLFYMAGNAGNGSLIPPTYPAQPNGVITGTGAQITDVSHLSEANQNPALPTPLGSFSVTELGDKADKVGKDTNFRGLAVYNNVVYMTKGSGSNGVNTVYFVDTTNSCVNGVGLPGANAQLPTEAIPTAGLTTAELDANGVTPYNMCILKGFNTAIAKTDVNDFPFGIWFANATTLYVADEGGDVTTKLPVGSTIYSVAAAQKFAGLQKWHFNGTTWVREYVLQAGLGLGTPYVVEGYPTGTNSGTGGTGLPWAPATGGLRNLTGRVNQDGTVTIWAVTATVSGSGDQGADPNQLVMITDSPSATSLPAGESFVTLRTAKFGQVLRGVSFTPTGAGQNQNQNQQ